MTPSPRRNAIEEEQRLCNEALLSGDFDHMSDEEWVALCERAGNNTVLSPLAREDGRPAALPVADSETEGK